MTIPIKRTNFSQNDASPGVKSWFKKLFRKTRRYLEMPSTEPLTLPETWLVRTGISSWPLASLVIGGGFYLIFLLLAYADGYTGDLMRNSEWWHSLILPAMSSYLLLIQPLSRRLLTRAIQTFRKMVPYNDRFRRLEYEAYALNRRQEWFAFFLGALASWLVVQPAFRSPYLSLAYYSIVGYTLVFGLLGWHIYSALVRTKLLTTIHSQIQDLNIFKEQASLKPIFEWSLGVAGFLLGAILLSAIFIPRNELFNPTTSLIYIILGLTTVLVLVFGKVPASLISQFRILRAFILFILIAVIGTIGFNQFESWDLGEAFYATIITMTTIGYGDYSPTTTEGRVFTIFLSLFAIGIGGYAVTSIASFVIEGNFHRFIQGRRVDKQIVRIKDHYILCGAGRMGRQVAIEFYKTEVPFVVIEQSPIVLEQLLREAEIPYIQGDATQDEILRLAGVERAKGLIAALSDDKSNVFIILSARAMNPNLRIISRVTQEKNRTKLQKAGANVIISPNEVSGRRMVSEMLHSEVVTLLDEMLRAEEQTGQTLRLEELHVDDIKTPALVERLEKGELHVTDIGQRTELMVVAVKRKSRPENSDPYIYTPRGSTKLERGDILIVISTPEQRHKLQHEVLSQSNFSAWVSKVWN
jgi:voltage-gated potassium channel